MRTRLLFVVAYYASAVPAGIFRGYADDFGLPVRRQFTGIESAVFFDGPSRWLQAGLIDVRLLQYGAVYVYASWFLLPLIATLPLLARSPRGCWRLLGFMVLVYYAGMPFFALYPIEPPWLHDAGIQRVIALVNPGLANKDDNPFAAMPSLHVALPAAAALWYGLRERYGRVLLAWSLLIAVTVVYSGDHYVADIVAGYALAAAVYVAARLTRLPLLREAADAAPVREL